MQYGGYSKYLLKHHLMLVLIVFSLARAICAPWRQSVNLVQHRD